ncbi:MAG: phosphotransferase [bacterium]|nr:phosphotransferase [bacterium]
MNSTIEAIKRVVADTDGLLLSDLAIETVAADASQRKFYRLSLPDGNTRIAMELEGPHPPPEDPDQVPYINILNHLRICKAAVPRLLAYDPATAIVILEDLGRVTLEAYVKEKGMAAALPVYRKAIDELLTLQIVGTRNRCEHCIAFNHAFDEEKLMWELNFFLTHTVEGQLKRTVSQSDLTPLRNEFYALSSLIAAEPRFFTHRDYHSRNLLVKAGKIGIVDFQDARLGPLQYDLCSLLRDSYVVLPEKTVDGLIDYYLDGLDRMESTAHNRETFRKVFDMVSIQRNLKAAGTFGYMATVKSRLDYLDYLPDTFTYVRQNLARYPELQRLRDLLGRYLPEIL